MTRANATRVSEEAWSAETLRLTLFHAPGALVRAEGWWERVAGHPPDSDIAKPKTGERVAIGRMEGTEAELVLHTQQRKGRIDWLLKVVGVPTEQHAPFPDRASLFLNLMGPFLGREELPSINRMAIGAQVGLPVPDLDQGYRRISDYLNFDIDRATAQDFLFQVNRRRRSETIPEVEINRLVKWSVGAVTRGMLAVGEEGLISFTDPEPASVGCMVNMDINTVPRENLELPRDRLEPLLREFVDLARQIIREGDV